MWNHHLLHVRKHFEDQMSFLLISYNLVIKYVLVLLKDVEIDHNIIDKVYKLIKANCGIYKMSYGNYE